MVFSVRTKVPEGDLLKILPQDRKERGVLLQLLVEKQVSFLSPWLDQMLALSEELGKWIPLGNDSGGDGEQPIVDTAGCRRWLEQRLGVDWQRAPTLTCVAAAIWYQILAGAPADGAASKEEKLAWLERVIRYTQSSLVRRDEAWGGKVRCDGSVSLVLSGSFDVSFQSFSFPGHFCRHIFERSVVHHLRFAGKDGGERDEREREETRKGGKEKRNRWVAHLLCFFSLSGRLQLVCGRPKLLSCASLLRCMTLTLWKRMLGCAGGTR